MPTEYKPRVRMVNGKVARIGWPSIVEYKDRTGALHPWPPRGIHRIIVHDLPAFEDLARSGLLYDPRHTGMPSEAAIDNRPAPGA